MPNFRQAVLWFKAQFDERIVNAIQHTAINKKIIAAIAIQESYEIWGKVYDRLPTNEVLALCTGDTLDENGGRNEDAFPRNKAELIRANNGRIMFNIAHQALVDMSRYVEGYRRVASNPDKFCHGYGIFQYDLQFFLLNPNFFLKRRWVNFDECLELLLGELKIRYNRYFRNRRNITDKEMVYLAIAYNAGRVNLNGDFRQGHYDGEHYYGEYIWRYLQYLNLIQ